MEQSLIKGNEWLAKLGEKASARVLGIDLGTTNSTVSLVDNRPRQMPKAVALELDQPTPDGMFTSPLVPSVVALPASGPMWVGEGAKRLRGRPQESGLQVEKSLFYDTKNEMGLRRSYHRAPETHDHPWKIAGHVLSFLCKQAQAKAGLTPDRVVVTVPASFQLNQRRDTLKAAWMAGLQMKPWDLLDEPTAALLNYLATHAPDLPKNGTPLKVLVFDFGGGTCDISIVDLALNGGGSFMGALRMTSRYHRLGGGDLDAAIVHDRLIPALLKETNLDARDLSWSQKKKGLEPQLLGTAEALKIALCREMDRLDKFGKLADADKQALKVHQPSVTCMVKGQSVTLPRPELSAAEWEKLLEPFLDTRSLFYRETEYRMTQSVFAPVKDALDRARLEPGDIGAVLLAGGSTLIPQVRKALERYFTSAPIWAFEDALSTQLAVSLGAAWHAWWMEAVGEPLLRPVAPEDLAMVTEGGKPFVLVPAGSPLPYPPDGSFATITELEAPRDAEKLKLEVVSLPAQQTVFCETWTPGAGVKQGDAISVAFRLGPNSEFEYKAYLADRPEVVFDTAVENPLCNVLNPGATRLKIEETEEILRRKGGPSAGDRSELERLSQWYQELRFLEKSQEYLATILRLLGRPDGDILNRQGILYGRMGDTRREVQAYQEAAAVDDKEGGPLFNLALSHYHRKDFAQGLPAIEQALERDPRSAPYQTLRGLILKSMGRLPEALPIFQHAHESYGALPGLDEWELHWCGTNAGSLEDKVFLDKVDAERKRRKLAQISTDIPDSPRPVLRNNPGVVN